MRSSLSWLAATTLVGFAGSLQAQTLGCELGGAGGIIPASGTGGGSDGNFTGAMGVPTLDGLGVRGADAHTLNEHIEVDSLAERGRLMAGLLATLE